MGTGGNCTQWYSTILKGRSGERRTSWVLPEVEHDLPPHVVDPSLHYTAHCRISLTLCLQYCMLRIRKCRCSARAVHQHAVVLSHPFFISFSCFLFLSSSESFFYLLLLLSLLLISTSLSSFLLLLLNLFTFFFIPVSFSIRAVIVQSV
jgi:hypothetical protein